MCALLSRATPRTQQSGKTGSGDQAPCPVGKMRVWLTLRSQALQAARLLYPWDSPGKNTGVNCHFLFQGLFLTQEWRLCLLDWQVDS